jgi:hypothetical protein
LPIVSDTFFIVMDDVNLTLTAGSVASTAVTTLLVATLSTVAGLATAAITGLAAVATTTLLASTVSASAAVATLATASTTTIASTSSTAEASWRVHQKNRLQEHEILKTYRLRHQRDERSRG